MDAIQLRNKLQTELIGYSVSLEGISKVDGFDYPTFSITDERRNLGIRFVYTPPPDERYFQAICQMVKYQFEHTENENINGDPQGQSEQE